MSTKHRHGPRHEEEIDRFGVDVRPEQRTIQQVMASRRNAEATAARQRSLIYGGKPLEQPREELTPVRIQHLIENAGQDSLPTRRGPSSRQQKRKHPQGPYPPHRKQQ